MRELLFTIASLGTNIQRLINLPGSEPPNWFLPLNSAQQLFIITACAV